MLILLGIVLVIILIITVLLRKAGGGSFPWIHFYVKGRESGFSFKEVNLLRVVAVENRLDNPLSLFWSIKQLDRSIRGMIMKFRVDGKTEDPTSTGFLSKLYDFRKKVEFDLPKYKLGLKTTRKIANHQRIKVSIPELGTYNSQVVENLRRYIAISYPEGPALTPGFSWKGQKVNVYFWRADDAGYVFQSRVIDDFYDRKYPILHITHSDSLVRSQKRKSIRVITNKPAFLYPLRSIASANEEEEKRPGLRCRLVDLSEDGAAVLIGGRARIDLPVKIQFALSGGMVVMCGVVKGVTFSSNKNQSVLHIQSVPLQDRTKNIILTYVYNIFQDRE